MTLADLIRPASSSVGNPLAALSDALETRAAERRRRRRLTRMLDLDDHMLDDIGVTRGEVFTASRLPLSVDAATALRRMSLERRRLPM